MNRHTSIVAVLVALAFAAFGCATSSSGTKWVTLIDGNTGLDNWSICR
ncbi:MAG TPA: hypothetical protein VJU53_02745 [Burkholderiaceae bacterium]|nr:hypothetical protein [Burkholderiaceae bacterium]